MSQLIINNILRFVLFFFLQVVILNQIEVGYGVQIMIYPLAILLLPVEMNVMYIMVLAFSLGACIDSFSNTFGLHTSALLAMAYSRPIVFKLFAPRDGYENVVEASFFTMGRGWFVRSFGLLLLIHHLWYFLFEMFKLSEILYTLQQTGLSVVISFIICVLFQFLFSRKPKKEL